MLANTLKIFVSEPFQENFYRKKKKEIKVMFGNIFFFYFQKLVLGNIKKKKQFSCIFEIKNMFDQLKLKNKFFVKKNRKY